MIYCISRDPASSISRKSIKMVENQNFKWQFLLNGQDDLLYIMVEFESDRISPRESAKNGRNGAHGLSCIIFVNSEFSFVIYDEN